MRAVTAEELDAVMERCGGGHTSVSPEGFVLVCTAASRCYVGSLAKNNDPT